MESGPVTVKKAPVVPVRRASYVVTGRARDPDYRQSTLISLPTGFPHPPPPRVKVGALA